MSIISNEHQHGSPFDHTECATCSRQWNLAGAHCFEHCDCGPCLAQREADNNLPPASGIDLDELFDRVDHICKHTDKTIIGYIDSSGTFDDLRLVFAELRQARAQRRDRSGERHVNSGSPLYPPHHPWELEPHYSRHVSAMTTEQLHAKADIAEQLAWRDQVIEGLRARVTELEAIACAAIVIADEHPSRITNYTWTRLCGFLNDRVRRSLVDAMKRQGLPFKEHPGGEWRSWEEP